MSQSTLSLQAAPGEEDLEKLLDQVLDDYSLVSPATPVSSHDQQIEDIYKNYERPASREMPDYNDRNRGSGGVSGVVKPSPTPSSPLGYSSRARPLPRPPQSDTAALDQPGSTGPNRYSNPTSPLPAVKSPYSRPSDFYSGIPPPPPILGQNNGSRRTNTASTPRPLPQAPENNFAQEPPPDGQRIYHLPSDPKHKTTTGGFSTSSRSTTLYSNMTRTSTSTTSLQKEVPQTRTPGQDLNDYFDHTLSPLSTQSSSISSGQLVRNVSATSSFNLSSPGSGPSTGLPNGNRDYLELSSTVGRDNSYSSMMSNQTRGSNSDYATYRPVAGPSRNGIPDPPEDYGFPSMGPSRTSGIHSSDIYKSPLDGDDPDYPVSDSEEEDENRFVNLAFLSHLAVRLRDKVPRGTHVKGGIPYHPAFTGKDIVSTIHGQIQRELSFNLGFSTTDRRPAVQVARSLQSQLFFYEVEWGGKVLQDSVEDVYMFLDDQEGAADSRTEQEELPTGVFPMLTKCYSPLCVDTNPCYAYTCPHQQRLSDPTFLLPPTEVTPDKPKGDWPPAGVDPEVLRKLPESEINRQKIIHKAISKEELYVRDLDTVEQRFIKALRNANPPVIRPVENLDKFIEEVFKNILSIRQCNRRLLEVMAVRQREQYPIIQGIGDIFLDAASEFRQVYPVYLGNLPLAEKRLKEELELNVDFKRWLEQTVRGSDSRRLELKHYLNRPSEHLHKYPDLLEAISGETAQGNPDASYLQEAIHSIRQLSTVAQLWTFQAAMGKGPTGKLEWHDTVPVEVRATIDKKEAKRQAVVWEVIKGEMAYVKDLENIKELFIRPLQTAEPPVIPKDRLSNFLNEVFHNYLDILEHHRKLLAELHEIQRDEHPLIRSVSAPLLDAALNWHDAYVEYVPNYPIACYRVDEEIASNPDFKRFFDAAVRLPDAHKLDLKNFINRPIPRLLRYPLLLKSMLDETPPKHEDLNSIPQVIDVLKTLNKETDSGIAATKERVKIWEYNSNLVFKPGEAIDMDLLAENRSLVHAGRLLRPPDAGFDWGAWTELFVLLFDNYMVFTKQKDKDGVMKYNVNRRPIPLDLLTPLNFTDPPQQRGGGLLRFRGNDRHADTQTPPGAPVPDASDARLVYPCTIHHNGRLGGHMTLYAETAQARAEWKAKLDEAIVLRKVVTDANKVFEVETLSSDTFLVPSIHASASSSAWNEENTFTGKVTCSVPFSTADGRGLVAVGCAEGVWIGLRHDPHSLRRVLHLKMVTQCAMLEDFGIFLVLADKALFAYHIEALVPSMPPSPNATRTPQKLNGNRDVLFFSVGTLNGRTLIIYMKKKGLDSVFRVLEPVVEKIAEKSKAPGGFGRFGFGSQRSEWFRIYRDFFLPSEAFDLIFLKARIAILCSKGFEIMDLTDFKSVTIPRRDDPRLQLLGRRIENCKAIGMFKSSEEEFLLCYDEFGLYVNRQGDPSRQAGGTIEWEGTAERVAWHPPHILLFDSRFIEVRHVETGRLVQIIPGSDIRCIWDGRGSSLPPIAPPGPDGWQDTTSQEARVHAVMKASEPLSGGRSSRVVVQHVFQLVPTIPLYLPGSLTAPHNYTYFTENGSPTHSPPSTPRNSWR